MHELFTEEKKKKTAESYQKMVALIWEWTKDVDT